MKYKSHKFQSEVEFLEFIQLAVQDYVGVQDTQRILYNYDRMTVEELAQEVSLKLLRTVELGECNKSYVRQAVMWLCIGRYRKMTDECSESPEELDDLEGIASPQDKLVTQEDVLPERLMQLDKFTERELKVVMLMLEGKRNPEIRETLGIPKMTYYTLIKNLYLDYALASVESLSL